jgi:hypothetical protein
VSWIFLVASIEPSFINVERVHQSEKLGNTTAKEIEALLDFTCNQK